MRKKQGSSKFQHENTPSEARLMDNKTFFSSVYKATIGEDEPCDRMTIPGITEVESRFHYNATENAIIRALARIEPLGDNAKMWELLQQRRELSVLDIGSGTGHWIDFYHDVYYAQRLFAVDIVPQMADILREKYKGRDDVNVLNDDISRPDFDLGEKVDIVSAIGVMFHIVDDEKWLQAIKNLRASLKDDGLMVVGGDFGAESAHNQFHRSDEFDTWSEHDGLEAEESIVNKRVRALTEWHDAANETGLRIADLVRSETHPGIITPENDILILRPA